MRSFTRLGVIATALALFSCEGAVAPEEAPVIVLPAQLPQLEVSDTLNVVAEVTNRTGNPLNDLVVTWASSNQAVATISEEGRVIAVAPGTTTLSASAGGTTVTAGLTVVEPAVAQVSLSPAMPSIRVTQSLQVAAVLRDKRSRTLSGRTIAWTSDLTSVATVSATGLARGIAPGSAVLTATSEGRSASLTIAVTPIPVVSVTLSAGDVQLLVSQTRSLTATPRDSVGGAIAGREVSWVIANPAVASVSSSGVVTALSPGATTLTANVEGVTSSANVQVANVPVASVSVSPSTATRVVTLTAQLTAATRDSAGGTLVGRPVAWTSSNAGVATVSGTGLVTAVAPGLATITATSEGRSSSAAFTVLPVPVATVTVTPATSTLYLGESVGLTVTLRDSTSSVLALRPVTYSSSAPTIASVSASGVVTVLAPGTATITATSEGKSATASITGRVRVSSVVISPSPLNLLVGQPGTLSANALDSTGTVLAGRGIAWTSSTPSVASVSSAGAVTATSPGVTTVTASSEGKSTTTTVTVTPVPVATLVLTPATKNLFVTQTVQLSPTTLDSIGGILTGRSVSWTSSDPSIASVSSTGLVTALNPGTATITGTSEGRSATAVVVSALVPVSSMTLTTPRTGIRIGEEMQLTGTPKDSVGGNLTGRLITWSSSNPAVANVSSGGFINAASAGSATITATTEGKSANVVLTVTPVPVTSVLVSPSAPTILTGTTILLTATPKDSVGNALLDRTVTWSADNASIASVDATGLVRAGTPGIGTITATSEGVLGSAAVGVVSALFPNEPAGLTSFSERSFNALIESGWANAFTTGLTIASDDGSPKSPTSIAVASYPAGYLGGGEPLNIYRLIPAGTDTLYTSFWVKFSDNWVGHPSGVNKIFHVFIGGRNRVVFAGFAAGAGNLIPQIRLQDIHSHGGFVNLSPNLVPTAKMNRGQWHRWEVVIRANTAADPNGSVEWWLDGVKVGAFSDIAYVPDTVGHVWTSINWAPTWGGTGSSITALQTQSIDHVYLSGR